MHTFSAKTDLPEEEKLKKFDLMTVKTPRKREKRKK